MKEVQGRNGMDDERFAAALAAQGITVEVYRAKVKREIEKAQLVNKEIRQRVNVSPEEIQRYYDAHRTDYEVAEQVKVRRHPLPVDRGADEDADRRASAPRRSRCEGSPSPDATSQELAQQFSEGPGCRQGGRARHVRAAARCRPELDEVVFVAEARAR